MKRNALPYIHVRCSLLSLTYDSLRTQVNEAFKDLSAIVDEQGHAIQVIEENIGSAHDSTEKGVGFLQVRAFTCSSVALIIDGELLLR